MAALLSYGYTCKAVQPVPDYFHHQVWTTEDGLPQASVHAVLQSREGYLWVATEGGVARFDGQSFAVFSHATVPAFTSDDISCLAEDRAGDLWFGTSDGLVRRHGEQYRRFSERDGLPSDEILSLAASATDLLVLTTAGAAHWQRDHFEAIRSSEVFTGLSGTQRGLVLVSSKGAAYRWADGQLSALAVATEESAPLLGVAISERTVWSFGSNFVQASSPFERKRWRIGVDLPGSRVQALYVGPHDAAWIGTNRGLVYVDITPGSPVRDYESLRGESVLSLYTDREGDLWVGTEASGLHVFQPRKFATVPGSSPEAVTTVARGARGMMYFGTRDDGLFQTDGTAAAVAPNKLTSPVILSLAVGANGDLWAGTPDGLNQIGGSDVRHWTIADGLPDNFVRSVTAAADGTVWAGTRFGLVHIAGKDVHTFTRADGLPSDSIGPLLEAPSKEGGPNVLWVGTSAGLCQYGREQFRCLLPPDQAKGHIVTALAADDGGAVWLAMHANGLALVEGDRIAAVRSSLLPAEIVGILADRSGYLWLRSTNGLYRSKASELRRCADDPSTCANLQISAYGRAQGMQSDELAGEGIRTEVEGPNGELWFATRRGVAMTNPEHLPADRVPPQIVLTQVQVDGTRLPPGAVQEISPGHRQYSFEYAGLNLNNPNGTRYRYMLDGFDRGWVDAGSRRAAYYTNLPPRQYLFRVRAANSDGLWSTDEATFQFRVLKPWYRTAWAYLLAICVAVLCIVAVVQLRVRAERRRFALVLQERTRVAREVHDTLAQDLVSVSLQVEMAVQHAKAGQLGAVTEQLTQTRSLVRQALESARQSIWNLRANLSAESLAARLTARVNAFRETKVSARLRIGGEYRRASPTIENEVMRIAGEAISNVERHSGASEMWVDLSYGADSLRLQIRDNGRGFDYEEVRAMEDHYGLRGLEERAASIQGRLAIESSGGQGTAVTLVVPLSERS